MGALQRVEKSARQIEISDYAVLETGALQAVIEGAELAAAVATGPPGLALYALSIAGDPQAQGAVTAGSLALQTANDVIQSELMREAKNEQAGIKRAIEEMKGDLQGVRQEVARLATACADLRECVCELRQHNRKIADVLEQFVEVAREGFTRVGVEITVTLTDKIREQIRYSGGTGQYYMIGVLEWLYEGKRAHMEYINALSAVYVSPSAKLKTWRIQSRFRDALQTREIKIGPGNAPAPGAPPSGGGTPTKPSLTA
jgi:hypothetical protein